MNYHLNLKNTLIIILLIICEQSPAQKLIRNIYDIDNVSSSPFFIGSTPKGVIFYASTQAFGYEPFVSNGNNDSTFRLKDIFKSQNSSLIQNASYTVGNLVYFMARDTTSSKFISLWRTDGTTEGTIRLIRIESVNTPSNLKNDFASCNGKLIFSFGYGEKKELWMSDGTPSGTKMLKDIYYTHYLGSIPQSLTELNDKVYFFADDGIHGRELWVTDGSSDGTHIVCDVFPGTVGCLESTFPEKNMFAFKGKLYFRAIRDVVEGYELMVSDGTDTGTHLFKNFVTENYKHSSPTMHAVGKDFFIFFITTNSGKPELWSSDGTIDGTRLIYTDINNGLLVNSQGQFKELDNKLIFPLYVSSQGLELWSSDGTKEGTGILLDIGLANISGFRGQMVVTNGKVYFNAFSNGLGTELWVTDGTSDGTKLYLDLFPGVQSTNFNSMIAHKGMIFAAAIENLTIGTELYLIDPREFLSIDDVSNANIFYPNPVKAGGIIQIEDELVNEVNIYDQFGKRISNVHLSSKQFLIPSELNTGIYYLEFRKENITTRKRICIVN